MPEGQTIEVAHHLHERGERTERSERRRVVAIEVGEAILLAFVAIATAWSGYQSALWDGQSAKLYGTSSRIRIAASQKETRGGQEQVYDGTTFNFWLREKLAGDTRMARAYEKRFRPEYRPAFHAWLATSPFTNPDAPAGPIYMPQYHNALLEQGARLDKQASHVFEQGARAREIGDKYVRTTVLLATVLFLIAVSQRFGLFKVRVVLLAVSLILMVISLASIAGYPRL